MVETGRHKVAIELAQGKFNELVNRITVGTWIDVRDLIPLLPDVGNIVRSLIFYIVSFVDDARILHLIAGRRLEVHVVRA
jgi:hypothetical protein